MIGTMRKHQSWLWMIIIGVVIFTFVVFFQPSGTGDIFGGRPKYNFGSINGREITMEEFNDARREVELSFFARYRQWPNQNMPGFDPERETYSRLLIIEKLKNLKVEISEDATVAMIAEIFGGESGKFSMEQYNNFMREINSKGLTEADFTRLIKHEVGQQHLISLYGLSGKLVPPQEAEELFKRENETLNVDAVFFHSSNYLSEVTINETNVQHYFEQNMPQYRIPNKVQINYVRFDFSNYLAKAEEEMAKQTNFNMVAQSYYQQRGGMNFFKDDKGMGLTFEQALPKIKDQFRKEVAGVEARKQAAGFINDVFNATESIVTQAEKLAKFSTLATEKNFSVKEPPALAETMMPKDLEDMKLSPQIRRAAFNLTEEEPITSSPVEGEDGFYVVALKARIPGQNAKFSDVKNTVTEDYKLSEARKAARRACDNFAQKLAAGLAEGRPLVAICTEAKVKPESLPPFTLATRSLPELKGRVELSNLQNAASRLAEGKSSDFLGTEDGGAVIYLRSRTPVSTEKLKAELPDFTRGLAEQRQYAAFNQWVQQLPQEMNLAVPQPETAPKK